MDGDPARLVRRQIAYYDAEIPADGRRLPQGMRDRLESPPKGRVLEIACGVGAWTEVLLESADSVTAVDASPHRIAVCRERFGASSATFVCADVFSWQPADTFDFIVFAFWLSHVPTALFESFWQSIREWLRPGGEVFFVDHAWGGPVPGGRAGEAREIVRRSVTDKREFDVVKVLHDPAELSRALAILGWRTAITSDGAYVQGRLTRSSGPVTPATR